MNKEFLKCVRQHLIEYTTNKNFDHESKDVEFQDLIRHIYYLDNLLGFWK